MFKDGRDTTVKFNRVLLNHTRVQILAKQDRTDQVLKGPLSLIREFQDKLLWEIPIQLPESFEILLQANSSLGLARHKVSRVREANFHKDTQSHQLVSFHPREHNENSNLKSLYIFT